VACVADCDSAKVPDNSGNLFWEIKPEEFQYDALYLSVTGWMTEGNARLLAAAPSLLDALKELIFASRGLVAEAHLRDAREAIAKAGGAQ